MRKIALLVTLAAMAAAPATAQPVTPPSAKMATAAKTSKLDKIACRTGDTTGGRLNRARICMTIRQWQDQAQENREATELLQRQGQNNRF
jgi:invasion protein IalB